MNRTDDWFAVDRPAEGCYRVVEADDYRQYLVVGSDRALLVDAGVGVGDLRGLVADLVDLPVTLALTHSHWDHIGNAAQFDDVRIHGDERAPDGRVTIDGRTDEFVERPSQFVASWRAEGNAFPDDFDPDAYAVAPVEDVTPAAPGEAFDLGDRRLETYHTPGHSPGHLALLDRSTATLYGGDVIHRDGGLYAHFRECDLEAYLDTFDRLVELRDDGAFDVLLTCHNEPYVGDDLAHLDRLRAGLRRILEGTADPEPVDTAWGRAHRYEFGGSPVFTRPAVP